MYSIQISLEKYEEKKCLQRNKKKFSSSNFQVFCLDNAVASMKQNSSPQHYEILIK